MNSSMQLPWNLATFLMAGAVTAVIGCGGDNGAGNDNEVITTVTLQFTPMGSGATVTASFNDADGDGGAAPTIDPIDLVAGKTYATAVRFLNALEDPPEDITDEVRDEADEHMVFFTGTAVNGPASNQPGAPLTHTYADMDANGVPIGLNHSIVTAPGSGQLTVTLRHLPPLNSAAVKVASLPDQVKEMGLGAVAGSTDASVTFMVTVE